MVLFTCNIKKIKSVAPKKGDADGTRKQALIVLSSFSKEEVEKCKEKDLLEEMLREMTGEFPPLSEVFVSERDLFLTNSLRQAARPIPNPEAETGMVFMSSRITFLGVHLYKSESNIAFEWIHRESNLMFTLSSDKDQKKIIRHCVRFLPV